MNNDTERDYLIEKLAGRLLCGIPMTDRSGKVVIATHYEIYSQQPLPGLIREETYNEWRSRLVDELEQRVLAAERDVAVARRDSNSWKIAYETALKEFKAK